MDGVILMNVDHQAADEEGSLLVSLVSDIVSSVFDGGVNRGLIIGMHGSFAGLVLVLVGLWILTDFNGHVLALTGISLCLWVTTGWFVRELLATQRQQAAEKAQADMAAKDAATGEDSATTTATEGKGPVGEVLSKEAAIAQFQKAVSEAKKTR